MTDKLRPCPFCESVDISVIATETFAYLRCESCGAQGPVLSALPMLSASEPKFHLLKHSAICTWNTRPAEDTLRAKWEAIPWDVLKLSNNSACGGGWEEYGRLEDDDLDKLFAWYDANAPKEKHPSREGESNNLAKLTETQVIDIRQRYAYGDVLIRTLARELCVTPSTISNAIHGRTWSHLPHALEDKPSHSKLALQGWRLKNRATC